MARKDGRPRATLESTVMRNLRRSLVQRRITDGAGQVLDVRTAKYALAGDGMPAFALSPDEHAIMLYAARSGEEPFAEEAAARGYTLEGVTYRDRNGKLIVAMHPERAQELVRDLHDLGIRTLDDGDTVDLSWADSAIQSAIETLADQDEPHDPDSKYGIIAIRHLIASRHNIDL